jgi:hypothetical protein
VSTLRDSSSSSSYLKMRWQESRDWGIEAASFYTVAGVLPNTNYKSLFRQEINSAVAQLQECSSDH